MRPALTVVPCVVDLLICQLVTFVGSVGGSEATVKGAPKKEIHLAGIFPINGVEGWQGGQVRPEIKFHPNFLKSVLFKELSKPFGIDDSPKTHLKIVLQLQLFKIP